MFVRTYHKQTKTELAQRYYACKRCGAGAEVALFAEGSSGWQEDRLLVDDIDAHVRDRADADLRVDAERAIALAKCPFCHQRQPGAAGWAYTRVGFWFAIALVLEFLGTRGELASLVPTGLGIWQAFRERGRFRRARGALFSKIEPGRLPAPPPHVRPAPLAPPPDLPRARAITAPVHREEPADPASGPRFLVEK